MHHQHIQLNHYVLLQWYRYSYLQFVNLVTTEISGFYVNQGLPFLLSVGLGSQYHIISDLTLFSYCQVSLDSPIL